MQTWSESRAALQSAGPVAPVHILVGTEFALVNGYIDALCAVLGAGDHGAVEIRRFRYEDAGGQDALYACHTMSLFADASLVVLDDCTAFLASGKGKYETESIEQYLADPVPHRTLVIVVPGDKLDERKKLTKAAKRFPIVDCNTPAQDEAVRLLAEYCSYRNIEIEADALTEVWRRAGAVSGAMTELDKLHVYAAGRAVTITDVRELVSPPVEDNVFAWIDGVVKGRLDTSYQALTAVQRAGYDAFSLFALLGRQLRLMWFAKVLGGRGYAPNAIAAKAGAHPYALKVAAEQARHMRLERIERLLTLIADVEYEVKSGRRDPAHALDWVLLACAAAK